MTSKIYLNEYDKLHYHDTYNNLYDLNNIHKIVEYEMNNGNIGPGDIIEKRIPSIVKAFDTINTSWDNPYKWEIPNEYKHKYNNKYFTISNPPSNFNYSNNKIFLENYILERDTGNWKNICFNLIKKYNINLLNYFKNKFDLDLYFNWNKLPFFFKKKILEKWILDFSEKWNIQINYNIYLPYYESTENEVFFDHLYWIEFNSLSNNLVDIELLLNKLIKLKNKYKTF